MSNTMCVEPNSMPPEPDGALLAKGPFQLLLDHTAPDFSLSFLRPRARPART